MERVLFQLPEDPHQFFMSMPVAQAYIFEYVQEVASGQRYKDYQFVYRMHEKYEKYEQPLKVARDNSPIYDYTGWKGFARSEFQCFIDFDFDRAKELSLRNRKHIVEMMGVMYGCTPRRWPILPDPPCTQGKGILIIDWDHDQAVKLKKALGANTLLVDLDGDALSLEVETAEAVIGPACAATYLAATYKRTVVEIFPDEDDYCMYNNDGLMNYQAIIGQASADDVLGAYNNIKMEDDYAASLLGQE